MWRGLIAAYSAALLDTDRQRALRVVTDAQAKGMAAEDILSDIVIPAIDTLHDSPTHAAELSLAQHYMISQISVSVVEHLLPLFGAQPRMLGKVVIGSAQGDFHGLGKRIVAGCLRARMFDVIDLGLNVQPAKFVEQAERHGCEVIAISSMMVHTATGSQGCRGVRQALRERGLEKQVRIVVGGAPFRYDENLWREVGADGWADNGPAAGPVIERLIREVRSP